MVRTNFEDVQDACGTVLAQEIVDKLIDDANVYVDARLTGLGLSSNVLTVIEKYLACHLCAKRDDTIRITSESVGRSSVSYEGEDRFLKAAAMLDPSGTIAGDAGIGDAEAVLFEVAKTTRGEHYGIFD